MGGDVSAVQWTEAWFRAFPCGERVYSMDITKNEPNPNVLRRNLVRFGTVGTVSVLGVTGAVAIESFLNPPIRNISEPSELRLRESFLRSLTPGTSRMYRIGTRTLRLCCLKRTQTQRDDLLEQGIDFDDRIVFALDTRCPHLGCAVVSDSSTGQLHCPCHHSVFAPDGTRLAGPATENMTLFPVTIATEVSDHRERESPTSWDRHRDATCHVAPQGGPSESRRRPGGHS